ncbi:protein ALTERED XYLOGLUCAN 4 [Coffea eugenioides]|uniref:Xyloglucan O-acetyltransferase 1-like n=1 Tax=Coffea arabica TaxID=13443 RepID=A0A6P6V8N7_COFAR|nr:protein ALTERED XYLOGLUCAN 4-like [Coffea arabica]XP_027152569.1 protein ALTERED XYLOGLUCAN 4 [Coffea eugenioides]
MGSKKPLKHQSNSLLTKLLPWTFSILLPLLLIHLCFHPIPFLRSPSSKLHSNNNNAINNDSASPPSRRTFPSSQLHAKNHVINNDSTSPSPSQDVNSSNAPTACDYSNGEWIRDKLGPLYNGTTCGTIKDGQNCMSHGRPDKDYLYWRWKPRQCKLPRFEPRTFLQYLSNKHLAFVGDSVARNQLESLLCMITTVSSPKLVRSYGEDNKFRKWHFPSHNVTVSIFWSPFLVKGIEKSDEIDITRNYNKLYLDLVDEKWAGEIDHLDMIVLSVGHWFLHRAVYYYNGTILGCHYRSDQNCTEIGFYDVYGKAYQTAVNSIIDRKRSSSCNATDVFVTTFSPAHFEGEWDKFGACPKTKPYNASEKKLEGMDAEMRNIGIKEVKAAREKSKKFGSLRFEYVDVSALSFLRADGHPGPYLYPFPFANGIKDRVQNDCVHWCLPGPIDTWNEILLEIMKRRETEV